MRRWLNFNNCRQLNDIVACTVEGLSYVATAKDNIIMRVMYVDRINYAAGTMKRFHELTQKYYGVDDNSGYFLDLGANIGTTGIYFIKKLAPNLKLFAFEPDAENFKMLSVNLLLNDMEDKATIVKCGLGNKFDEMTMYRDLGNPGHNSLVDKRNGIPTETIKIMPLDAYFAENNIAAQDVKYIWIDTEGFEPQVILGAKNLLAENPAPIFMECNLNPWDNSGLFEDFMALLTKYYTHFILLKGRNETLYPLEALRTLERPANALGQVGDIFLIKAGVIA